MNGKHTKKSKTSMKNFFPKSNSSRVDAESVELFLSTDNAEYEDSHQKEFDQANFAELNTRKKVSNHRETNKSRPEKIVRQLLETFDLESTMEKYRKLSIVECQHEGKGLADFRFRSELKRLTGSDVIRLNDQTWSRHLQKALRKDYERRLDEQEKSLARLERHRLHKLRLSGYITVTGSKSSDDLISMAFFPVDSCKSSKRVTSGARKSKVKRAKMRNAFQDSSGNTKAPGTGRPVDKDDLRINDVKNTSNLIAKNDKEDIAYVEKKRVLWQKKLQSIPPILRDIYTEETLHGLYSLADKLVTVSNRNSNT